MIGFRTIRMHSTSWRRLHGALVRMDMPHVPLVLSASSMYRLLLRGRALFVRWEDDFDLEVESEWWHVLKDVPEELGKLSSNTRSKVRRGLKCFVAQPERREVIAAEGYGVYRAAFNRYKTFEEILSAADFQAAVEMLPTETEFWSVRVPDSGRIVAFSENLVLDGACFYNTIWFEPESLKKYSGYVLFHEMNKHYLNDRALSYVSDGARNISHQTNIHDFLMQKFHFRRAYSRLRVLYFPGLGVVVRLLYPLRKWIVGYSKGPFQRVAVLLEQERIQRSCARLEDGLQ